MYTVLPFQAVLPTLLPSLFSPLYFSTLKKAVITKSYKILITFKNKLLIGEISQSSFFNSNLVQLIIVLVKLKTDIDSDAQKRFDRKSSESINLSFVSENILVLF